MIICNRKSRNPLGVRLIQKNHQVHCKLGILPIYKIIATVEVQELKTIHTIHRYFGLLYWFRYISSLKPFLAWTTTINF